MITKKVGINKISITLLTLLLALNLASATIVFAESDSSNELQGETKIPEIPGLPENVTQYNKTDITPVAQTEKVLSGEPTLFAYQNTTMLFNFTQNVDLVITSEASTTQKIFALTIDPNQTMTLTMNFGEDPFQFELERDKNLNFYANIEPNETVKLTAQLKLYINQSELSKALDWEVDPEKLTWMFWNGTQNEWVKVPSFIDQNGYLTCNTDHFSVWTVGEEATEQTQDVADMTLMYGGLGIVLSIVVVLGLVLYRKRS